MAPAAWSARYVPVRGASTAAGPWMLHSGRRRFLLLDPPRTIQSGASGLSGAAWPRLPLGVAPRPWLCGCGARCPGLRHPAAVVAWHLSVCRGCGRRRASPACLVAPRGAPRLVRSGRSRCSGRLFQRRGAFPHPGGFRPQIYWAAAQGTRRPAENRAHCACRWPPTRQGRWARSASYPFGAPRRGCPWRVPPASVFGCVRCGGWRVWTQSLTRPVSRTVRLSTGDSARAPRLFRVDADNSPCGSDDATPGSRVCVRVLLLPCRVGSGRPPGRVLVCLPFSSGHSVFLLCSASSGLGLPLSLVVCLPSPCCPSPGPPPPLFLFPPPLSLAFFGFRPRVPWALAVCLSFLPPPASVFFCVPFVSGFLWCPAPVAPGLGAVCCLFCSPPASRLSVPSCPVGCSLVVVTPPLPPPFVSRGFRRCPSVLFFFVPPLFLAFAGFRPRVPWTLALWPVCFVGLPLLCSLCALILCVPPRCWPLFGGCCPPPPPPSKPSVALFLSPPLGAPSFCFFRSFVRRPRCLFPRCLWLSLVSGPGALGLGTVCCSFWWPAASRSLCGLASFVFPAWPSSAPWWLLSRHPLLCVSRFLSLPLRAQFFFFAPPLSLAFARFRPRVPWALALCAVCFFFASRFSAGCALWPLLCLLPGRGLLHGVCCPPPPPPPFVSRGFRRCLSALGFFFCCAPPLSLPFSSFRPRVPWALALCVVCSPRGWLWCPVFCFVLCRVLFSCGLFVRFVLRLVLCGVLVSVCVLAPCCVGSCCAVFVVLCCRALLRSLPVCFFFLAFPWCSGLFRFPCSACAMRCRCGCGVALCALLSCPCGAGWCFVLLSVVFACLLLGLAVLCCLLAGPGGSWCRVSVVCCGVFLGAVLPRVAACLAVWCCVVVRCVVSFCSAWCCRALCRVLGRCLSSCGPVSSALCVVLSRRAVCVFAVLCCCLVLFAAVLCAVRVLGCLAVRSLSSPPCAVLLSVPALPWCPAPLCGAPWCCAAVWRCAVLSCCRVCLVSPICKTAAKFVFIKIKKQFKQNEFIQYPTHAHSHTCRQEDQVCFTALHVTPCWWRCPGWFRLGGFVVLVLDATYGPPAAKRRQKR